MSRRFEFDEVTGDFLQERSSHIQFTAGLASPLTWPIKRMCGASISSSFALS